MTTHSSETAAAKLPTAGRSRARGRGGGCLLNTSCGVSSAGARTDEWRRAMATLLSLNVGLPMDVSWRGRTVHTGVWKSPVTGPRMVRRLNIDGDGQGDLAGHGGEQRAVLVYQIESYRYWQDFFQRDDLEHGAFGENFTVEG